MLVLNINRRNRHNVQKIRTQQKQQPLVADDIVIAEW